MEMYRAFGSPRIPIGQFIRRAHLAGQPTSGPFFNGDFARFNECAFTPVNVS
jgi:hypothetical protein